MSCLFAVGNAQATPAKEDPFKTLVAKVKAGDTSVDFKALRMASAESDAEEAGAEADTEEYKKAAAAFSGGKFKDAVSAGERSLKSGYLDIRTHLLLALAYEKLKNTEKFEFHKAVYLGLVNSILKSGDGKSADTAYVVIAVAEEYAILDALQLGRGSQSLQSTNGHQFDVLSVTDSSGKAKQVWFNIDIVWKGYDKIFKDK
jgi:hypothetical protein